MNFTEISCAAHENQINNNRLTNKSQTQGQPKKQKDNRNKTQQDTLKRLTQNFIELQKENTK